MFLLTNPLWPFAVSENIGKIHVSYFLLINLVFLKGWFLKLKQCEVWILDIFSQTMYLCPVMPARAAVFIMVLRSVDRWEVVVCWPLAGWHGPLVFTWNPSPIQPWPSPGTSCPGSLYMTLDTLTWSLQSRGLQVSWPHCNAMAFVCWQ